MTQKKPRIDKVKCFSPAGLHRMAFVEWGDPTNSRVIICAHGLTRTGRDFDILAQHLSQTHRVICPDFVGRGESDWLTNSSLYSVPQYVADMMVLIARLGVQKVDWFGTSMGGIIGMSLAALPHAPIQRLLLNDIGPKIELTGLQRLSTYVGHAHQFETQEAGFDYLAQISLPYFGPHSSDEWKTLNAAMLKEKEGKYQLHYDPSITISVDDIARNVLEAGEKLLWKSFENIHCPILVARGAQSDLLSQETVSEMMRRNSNAKAIEIPNAGHAPTFIHDAQIAIATDFFANG